MGKRESRRKLGELRADSAVPHQVAWFGIKRTDAGAETSEMSQVPAIPLWAGAFLAAGLCLRLAVGAWVVSRAVRLRGLPETIVGGFILLFALGELAVVIASAIRGGAGQIAVPALAFVSLAAIVAATTTLAEGVRRLFRPESRWLRLAVGCLAVALLVAAWQRWLEGSPGVVVARTSLANGILMAATIAVDLWWGAESLTTGRRLRRQAALGLADSQSARRFDLWALAACSHASMALGLFVCAFVLRRPAVELPALLALLGLAGAVSALAIQASFHLPRFLQAERPRPAVSDADA